MSSFAEAYTWINFRFLLEGLWVTVEVSLVSIILSFIIGSALGIVRYIRAPFISTIVGIIIDLIRNLPLLLLLFFTYFGLPKVGIRMDPLAAAISAMTVFESAMIAEIIRSGIQAVDTGQMEGARACGLTYWQALRVVVLPQALRKMIPPLVSQFISLIKDTSLATIIVLPELLYRAQIIYGQNTRYMIPMFVALAVMYFVVCYALSLVAARLEKTAG
ncbi:amino acid ABC transporter permease [Liquorilactobacillus satsumensis]|uniref:amino acid ABC transporter permease n=1 Tax=Liquorilactobacillus satsumensis TaxID=259059 RepID=UPI0021C2EB3B|nr:amino acid ABC transporter permease [Liquorilactobacillus satsumensis]MCP9313486.1 amino acid ABC transporter permease [Liquorilactobacillus satsumensis]MCP9329123.1 amino acid ABC transporter permease [Liquorilactobacillus satsumensis]MCP9360111.1 amino acid ABC transporter permease [Liquorilactobacillus satsumensis]